MAPWLPLLVLGGAANTHWLFAPADAAKPKVKAAAAAAIDAVLLLRGGSSSEQRGRGLRQRNISTSNAAGYLFQRIKAKSKAFVPTSATGTTTGLSSSEEEFRVLTALTTKYNDIVIVETSTSRILLLDSTHNVHSIFHLKKGNGDDNNLWTNSYWDEFASLPAIVPQGPIALLGLGGGTSARLMLHVCPSLNLHGWEIDRILIDKSREYLGLSDLEKCTQTGGSLAVHVGDALSPSASIPGGFSGIAVDLFSSGKILPQLQEVTTWLELNNKLMSHGRIMVNCGGADNETSEFKDRTHRSSSSDDGLWVHNSTIKALCQAFPGKLEENGRR
ncbi:hypothetical protein AQUCO_03500003v1 [Aquilegia coerulea]|uniref:PABS domain-containing protein n=1 Tax=Aquilegia coerulea TaxID=218851 RepID=A0A2G5CWK4_AQUCA|nr:hypothetical protein AQUCO_03500003v1 [Aquilegia coerulea]